MVGVLKTIDRAFGVAYRLEIPDSEYYNMFSHIVARRKCRCRIFHLLRCSGAAIAKPLALMGVADAMQ